MKHFEFKFLFYSNTNVVKGIEAINTSDNLFLWYLLPKWLMYCVYAFSPHFWFTGYWKKIEHMFTPWLVPSRKTRCILAEKSGMKSAWLRWVISIFPRNYHRRLFKLFPHFSLFHLSTSVRHRLGWRILVSSHFSVTLCVSVFVQDVKVLWLQGATYDIDERLTLQRIPFWHNCASFVVRKPDSWSFFIEAISLKWFLYIRIDDGDCRYSTILLHILRYWGCSDAPGTVLCLYEVRWDARRDWRKDIHHGKIWASRRKLLKTTIPLFLILY